ncbi:LacI family DNA-binding transcriptional regulator [Arthrobacter sp. S2(2024)]|uniref:LacI family DNA-binding transcriptional regulator n=1 Tax=Arthrobacter sp. S2(2024) TaxID=3111911 RepID=UPI002FC58B87
MVVSRTVGTLQDVAAAAGVSKSVASRVLNDDTTSRISETTRAKVKAIAAELSYVPNHRSRALRFARSGALGLIIPDVNNSVFSDLFTGVQEISEERGVSVFLGQASIDGTKGRGLASVIGQGRVDGVILQRPETVDDKTLLSYIDTPAPVVLFNSVLPNRTGSVTLDDVPAARAATEYLIGLGHRDIALLGGTSLHDAAARRRAGYMEAMADAGLQINPKWMLTAGWEADAGAAGMRKLLEQGPPPTAVVVASVNAGLGAASEAAHRGIRVPGQLSIICIQDSWTAQVFVPSLTVVRMPLRRAGAVAAQMLLDHLDGAVLSDEIVRQPPPEIVARSSTAAPFI